MRLSKILTVSISCATLLSISTSAHAGSTQKFGNQLPVEAVGVLASGSSAASQLNSMTVPGAYVRLIGNGSETASFYYSVGVKQFNRKDMEKAERAFKAVLRADGLDKAAHHYLAVIYKEKGDIANAEKHALAFAKAR